MESRTHSAHDVGGPRAQGSLLCRPALVIVSLLLAVFAACSADSGPSQATADSMADGDVSEPADSCAQSAEALIEEHCANCHSKSLAVTERGGAPMGVNLDNDNDIARHAARIRARALVDRNMPPAYVLEKCAQDTLEAHLSALENTCIPMCEFRQCGDDGCGGSCGECDGELVCDAASQECVQQTPLCTPDCADNQCGDDGCGGLCGECVDGLGCAGGQCVCIPNCDGVSCGDDGCGGSCGMCGDAAECSDTGTCECVSDCDVGSCGFDRCGNLCGTCDDPSQPVCNSQSKTCVAECVPNCDGRACGDDGCGGACGDVCSAGDACDADGQCVCVPDCDGLSCGDDGCGGTCGTCTSGLGCDAGECVCIPDCDGLSCGADGCGGVCGTCASGTSCDGTSCQLDALSFSIVYDVLQSNACIGCHSGNGPAGGLNFGDQDAAFLGLTTQFGCGQPLIDSGNAAGSYLIAKLNGTATCGDPMPPVPSPSMSAAHLAIIAEWIDAGAAW